MKEVTFLLPVFNKEKKIGLILEKLRNNYPNSKIIVIDNNSKDKTAKIAYNSGAQVLHEKEHGKYLAIKKGFRNVKTKFAVLLDADDIHPEEIKKLVKNILTKKTDILLGSKINNKQKMISITKFNLINYYLFLLISSLLYYKTSDVFTGYWVFKRNFIDYILQKDIHSTGFEGETEMFSIISKGKFKIVEMPVKPYNTGNSITFNPLNDNWKIYRTITGLIRSN